MTENAEIPKLKDVIDDHVRWALLASRGNQAKAAKLLGISRATMYRWMKRIKNDSV